MSECCVCHQENPVGTTFQLTEEEKSVIGSQAPDEVFYCQPCLTIMQDREAGAQLLKGLYEMRLKELGVGHAKEAAQQLLKLLKGK